MHRRLVAGALGLALTAGIGFADAAGAESTPVHLLLDGNRLVTVSIDDPSTATADVVVVGLEGRTLVGIDRRPSDQRLYGVAAAADGTSPALYRISGDQATLVAPLVVNGTTTPIVLDGTAFGVDFNPFADALRIVSDEGQNLRVTPAGVNGTGATIQDGALGTSGIAAAAYTNNVAAAPNTVLHTLDTALDRLNRQDPPNAGNQVPIGPLGRPTTSAAGFDIRTVGGVDTAYAVLTQSQGGSGTARLVTVDLTTGAVEHLGALGRFRSPIGMAL